MSSERWSQLVAAERAFFAARTSYISEALADADIRAALAVAGERGSALRLLLTLEPNFSEQFLEELVDSASVGHSDIGLVRAVMARFYRPSLEPAIELAAQGILEKSDTDEEYRRLAELFSQLGMADSLYRHLEKCRHHASADIAEIAEDFPK